MEWFILSRDMHVLCAPSTDSPNSLPIFDDKQTILLSNNTVVSTYDFSVQQKHPDAQYLQMGNYIVFVDKYHKTKMYTLMSHDGDDLTHTWHAEDVGLDLLNESSEKWDYTGQPHDIAWYLDNLVLKDSGWTIGINEASILTRALKFDGETDTQLRRLGDIANQFDGAEVDFTIEMNGAQVTKQVVNIYKKVGSAVTQGRYIDSVNLKSLHSSGSIGDLITAVKPFGAQMDMPEGQEGEAPRITIADVAYDDGRYYSPKGHPYLYDREARQQWSRFKAYNYANQGEFDGYIVGSYTYDTKDPNELLNRALTELKSRNKPSETYEANLLDINADIGDYVQIAHNQYNPPIYLSARVESVTNCYTANGQDTGVLGDYRKLESDIDPRIKEMLNALENQIKSHYMWIRYAEDDKGKGMTSVPTVGTKYIAILVNKPTAIPSDNPADYAGHWQLIQGQDGSDGIPGPKGEDGRTSYTHFAYANNVSGTEDFSTDDPTGRSYMGVYSDFTKVDSNNPSDYVWSYTKGETGPEGTQGIPGKPGIDGKTPYTHVAYADDNKGGGFSQSPDNKAYMGWYSDFTQADSTDVTKYAWSLIKGADGKDGIPGKPGADGKSSYTHIAYADSATGGGFSQQPDGKAFIGMYVDFEVTDSTDVTKYNWSLVKGEDGSDGTPGKPGADGKTPYFHIAYADSADGKGGFYVGGGTNLLTGTGNHTVTGTNVNEYLSNETTANLLTLFKGLEGQTVTVSVDYEYSGFIAGSGTNRLGWEVAISTDTTSWNGAWFTPNNESGSGRVSATFVVPKNITGVYESMGYIQFSGSGTGTLSHLKLEKGSVATPWSPAPSEAHPIYMGTYTDYTQADSLDPTAYIWTQVKGVMGQSVWSFPYNVGTNVSGRWWSDLKPAPTTDNPPKVGDTIIDLIGNMYQITNVVVGTAEQGGGTFDYGSLITSIKGTDGANGAPGKPGADGRTPYFHQAWADSKDGKINFSTTDPTNRGYLGTYSDFTQADSTDPSKYFWVELVGNLQVGVRNLLKGTADFSDGLNVSGANGTVITDEVYNGNRVVKEPQLTASNSYHDPYTPNTIDVAKGEYYALSFYAKTDAPSMVMRCYFFSPTNTISSINNQGFTSTSSDGLSTFTITNQWKQYWIVWRTNINTTVKRVIIGRREKSLTGSDTGAIFINSPMLVEGNKAVGWQAAPEDTQQQIDKVNNGLEHVEGLYNSILTPIASVTAPTNPKNGQQWWVLDANGRTTGFKIWTGSAWKDATIQQSAMNIGTLNGNIINGATINSSNFNVAYDETAESSGRPLGPWFKGTQVIKNGSYLSNYQVKGSTQTGYTYLTPDGLTSRINNNDGSLLSQVTMGRGGLSLEDTTNSGDLYPGDVERTSREVWTTSDGVNSPAPQCGFQKQFRRVWLDGLLAVMSATDAHQNFLFKLKNPKLYPTTSRWISLLSLADNPQTAIIRIDPDGSVVCVSSHANYLRCMAEGAFYLL